MAAARSGAVGAPSSGVSYLEAKHLLLLTYALSLTFLVLLRAEGHAVAEHPVIGRLLACRATLEKAKPIDRRTAGAVDRLLRIATAQADKAAREAARAAGGGGGGEAEEEEGGGGDGNFEEDADGASLRPNLAAFAPAAALRRSGGGGDASGGGDGGGGGGIYRPPRVAPTAMDGDGGDGGGGRGGREARAGAERRRRAARSSLVQRLAEEIDGAPEVIDGGGGGGFGTSRGGGAGGSVDGFVAREAARSARRAAEEESLFVRVPLSKAERGRGRAAERRLAGGAGGGSRAAAANFGDDVADMLAAVAGAQQPTQQPGSAPLAGEKRLRSSSLLAAAGDLEPKRGRLAGPSGDADAPRRQELGERRAAFERRPAPKPAQPQATHPAADDAPLYAQAEAAAAQRKAARKAAFDPATRFPAVTPRPAVEVAAGEKRPISGAMATNRGLTPHRSKDAKNPRVKHRHAYEKAKARRSGAVRAPVEGAAGGYAGELTGIKASVSRSRKL